MIIVLLQKVFHVIIMLLQKGFHVIIMLLQKGYHRILGAFGIKEKKEEEPIIETGRQRQYHHTGKQYLLHLLGYNVYHPIASASA